MEIKKVITLKVDFPNVGLVVDGDVDGEPSVSIQVKLPEVLSEIVSIFKPKAQ